MRFHFAEVTAVEVKHDAGGGCAVTVELGKGAHLTLHIPNGYPVDLRPGDKIPLTAEIPIGRTYKD